MKNCNVIAITNQKGGVGKTTTTVNLGVGLVKAGKRVLLIDADPQGSLTLSLGVKSPDDLEVSLATHMSNIMQERPFDERKFETYPDLLTIGQFCAMLGGIAESTARRLLQQGLVEHFMIRTTYYIPKIRAIDYIVGQHYRRYRHKLRHRIDCD